MLLQEASTTEAREAVAGNSMDRKIREVRYAVALEKKLTKDEILERYLNIAYFGDGAYGVGTAADHYFGVPISEVTLEQAALLAGLVQSPSRYDPINHPQEALTRRNTVLTRMADEGYITPTQGSAAQQMPLDVIQGQSTAVDSCENSDAPFFCDYVRTRLRQDPALGATLEERDRKIYEGGLVIQTTLEPAGPAGCAGGGRRHHPQGQPGVGDRGRHPARHRRRSGHGGQPGLRHRRGGQPDEGRAAPEPTFQPGSTFKTFTMVAALEQGYGVSTAFYSPAC